jgi:hypothetical protein
VNKLGAYLLRAVSHVQKGMKSLLGEALLFEASEMADARAPRQPRAGRTSCRSWTRLLDRLEKVEFLLRTANAAAFLPHKTYGPSIDLTESIGKQAHGLKNYFMHPHRRQLRERQALASVRVSLWSRRWPASRPPTCGQRIPGQLGLFGRPRPAQSPLLIDRHDEDLRQGDVESANDRSTPAIRLCLDPELQQRQPEQRSQGQQATWRARSAAKRCGFLLHRAAGGRRRLPAPQAHDRGCARSGRPSARRTCTTSGTSSTTAATRRALDLLRHHRPKPREVFAAGYRDRVVHHLALQRAIGTALRARLHRR